MKSRIFVSLLLALVMLVTLATSVMAKPVDHGYRQLWINGTFTDEAGHTWWLNFVDYYDPATPDVTEFECVSPDIDETYLGDEFESRINIRKGTATFRNAYVDITIRISDRRQIEMEGSHKQKSWSLFYEGAPGSIDGTITHDTTTYQVHYTSPPTSDYLYLEDYHNKIN